MAFFFFGTLRDRTLLKLVLDRSLDHLTFVPGWIAGYTARRAQNETFPVLIDDPIGRLDGVIVDGLTETDTARIRFFEDPFYVVDRVRVETTAGSVATNMFLVTDPTQATEDPWTLEGWPERDRRVLRRMAVDFLAFFETSTYEEADEHWEDIRLRAERAVDAELAVEAGEAKNQRAIA